MDHAGQAHEHRPCRQWEDIAILIDIAACTGGHINEGEIGELDLAVIAVRMHLRNEPTADPVAVRSDAT